MSINKIDNNINTAFDKFYNDLEDSMFGLYIQPTPLKPEDDVEIEEKTNEEIKPLDFRD